MHPAASFLPRSALCEISVLGFPAGPWPAHAGLSGGLPADARSLPTVPRELAGCRPPTSPFRRTARTPRQRYGTSSGLGLAENGRPQTGARGGLRRGGRTRQGARRGAPSTPWTGRAVAKRCRLVLLAKRRALGRLPGVSTRPPPNPLLPHFMWLPAGWEHTVQVQRKRCGQGGKPGPGCSNNPSPSPEPSTLALGLLCPAGVSLYAIAPFSLRLTRVPRRRLPGQQRAVNPVPASESGNQAPSKRQSPR